MSLPYEAEHQLRVASDSIYAELDEDDRTHAIAVAQRRGISDLN